MIDRSTLLRSIALRLVVIVLLVAGAVIAFVVMLRAR